MTNKKKIKVMICKASDLEYEEIKEFETAEEMLEYMKKTYDDWIIYFNHGYKDVDIQLWIYDDFME